MYKNERRAGTMLRLASKDLAAARKARGKRQPETSLYHTVNAIRRIRWAMDYLDGR